MDIDKDQLLLPALKPIVKPFLKENVFELASMYTNGMRGVGEKYRSLIEAASMKTQLSEGQIKVCWTDLLTMHCCIICETEQSQ